MCGVEEWTEGSRREEPFERSVWRGQGGWESLTPQPQVPRAAPSQGCGSSSDKGSHMSMSRSGCRHGSLQSWPSCCQLCGLGDTLDQPLPSPNIALQRGVGLSPELSLHMLPCDVFGAAWGSWASGLRGAWQWVP